MADSRIVVFTRYPVPGKTKTRMIPALGPVGAAGLQRQMAGFTVLNARLLRRRADVEVEIRYTGGSRRSMRNWLGPDLAYVAQGNGDLGARMADAFDASHRAGAGRTVVVGTDCPAISPDVLAQALDALGQADVVIGPAVDGGYYLLGLRTPTPRLFEGIPWGTGDVLELSLQAAASEGLSVERLAELPDVDRPEDLHIWRAAAGLGDAGADDTVSVIIPTLNEAGNIQETVERALPGAEEVLVADGGSSDGTRDVAAAAGATVLAVPGGRPAQLNTAAMASRGGVLLFLHADTHLPADYAARARETLAPDGVVAGAFAFAVRAGGRSLRAVERVANWRSRLLQMPYGDQSLFVGRGTFFGTGGFSALPIMDDFELVCRLRHIGRIATAREAAATSARRWQALGAWRTTAINQLMILGYHAGVSPARLKRFYRRQSGLAQGQGVGAGGEGE